VEGQAGNNCKDILTICCNIIEGLVGILPKMTSIANKEWEQNADYGVGPPVGELICDTASGPWQ
jgi:hypothetical protein